MRPTADALAPGGPRALHRQIERNRFKAGNVTYTVHLFERADHEGMDYSCWRIDRVYLLVPAQAFVVNWLQSFKEFPPRQKPASFGIDQVMDKLTQPPSGSR
jgi:hypothetical protein